MVLLHRHSALSERLGMEPLVNASLDTVLDTGSFQFRSNRGATRFSVVNSRVFRLRNTYRTVILVKELTENQRIERYEHS